MASITQLRLRGKTYHLDYYENGVRKRFFLRTDNLQIAELDIPAVTSVAMHTHCERVLLVVM